LADPKFGRLPTQNTVRVTIVRQRKSSMPMRPSTVGYQPIETATLLPHMLLAFLRTNRVWLSSCDGWPSLQALETWKQREQGQISSDQVATKT
jgi:hypothetical protein